MTYVPGKSPSSAEASLRVYIERELHAIARAIPTSEARFPTTDVERDEAVTVVNDRYQPGDVWRYHDGEIVFDSSTDWHVGMQSALSLSHHYPMLIRQTGAESRYYRITDELVVPEQHGIQVRASGYFSIVRQATAGKGFVTRAAGPDTTLHYARFENVFCGMLGNIEGGTAFNLEGMATFRLDGCDVIADNVLQGFATGYRCWSKTDIGRYCYYGVFTGSSVRTCVDSSSRGFVFGGDAGHSANSHHIFGGRAQADDGVAVHMMDSGTHTNGVSNANGVHGVVFEGESAIGVLIDGDGTVKQGHSIDGACRFENGANIGVHLAAGSRANNVSGNMYSPGTSGVIDDGVDNQVLEPTFP